MPPFAGPINERKPPSPAEAQATMIIVPPRAYFDTANLAKVADEDLGGPLYPAFRHLVTTGAIVPVFSYAQITERVAVSMQTIRRMDQRIAPLIREGHGCWVRDFNTLQRIEIERELHRQGFGPDCVDSPTVPTILDLRPDENVDPDLLDSFSFEMFAQADRNQERRPFRTLGSAYGIFQARQREQWGSTMLTKDDQMESLSPYLPQQYGGRFPGGFELDTTRMPFCHLMLGYFSGSLLSDGGDEDSDLMDIIHLSGVAYADFGFVDAKTHDRLRRGNALRDGILKNSSLASFVEERTKENEPG